MGYRIDAAVPTDVELRRVIDEQLVKAVAVLHQPDGPGADGVHEVRKRLKKVRSALRLGRADFGAHVRRHANDEFRRVGHELSEQRDADAQVEAVDGLLSPPGASTGLLGRGDEALLQVRGVLETQADDLRDTGTLDRATVTAAVRTLERTGKWLADVEPRQSGWDALSHGLAREYRRGRNAMADLGDTPSVDALHEWRKRVKDLWYHERLLRNLWPDLQKPVVAAADELADLLGQDHDLGLLIARLAPRGEHVPADVRSIVGQVDALPVDPELRDLVTVVARDRRTDLQTRSRWLGARLYADRPKSWTRRRGAWWAASERGPEGFAKPARSANSA